MTVGQRIGQKRREAGLSQESLGQTLGVSRQSIYKWESDGALPEIDKLIALSRLFGVSVGWLLGVEADASESANETGGEQDGLTEQQLKMVEEIAKRYAVPPKKSHRGKFLFILCAVMLACVVGINGKVKEIDRQYDRLQGAISNIQSNVSIQIGSVSSRVEEILKAQNSLTADYGVEQTGRDLSQNTVTFSARAVPKTYVTGLTAVFLADSGSGPVSFPAEEHPGQEFTAQFSAELTDSINISVVFVHPDGTRQTQLLDNFSNLWSGSMPYIELNSDLMRIELTESNALVLGKEEYRLYILARRFAGESMTAAPDEKSLKGPAEIAQVQVGLFKNQTLVTWAEPCDQPDSFHGFDEYDFYRLPPIDLPLTAADTVQVAAVIEDVYGRTAISSDSPYCLDTESHMLTYADSNTASPDPADWDYD